MRARTILGMAVVGAALAAGAVPGRTCAAGETASYVGAAACRKCHPKQGNSWAKTKMAAAFDVLKPYNLSVAYEKALAEKRKGAGLDPEKDYRTDPKCLKCHTTGYGQPGGYPATVTRENEALAAKRQGVQCEACHGPGSLYVPFFEKLMKEEGKYKRSDVLALGLVLPAREVCVRCHNKESPFVTKDDFDFEKMKDQGTHQHVKIQDRVDGEEGKPKEGAGKEKEGAK